MKEIFAPGTEPMTNADRIRSMTDMELAKFLLSVACSSRGWCDRCASMDGNWCVGVRSNPCTDGLEWLKSPVGQS